MNRMGSSVNVLVSRLTIACIDCITMVDDDTPFDFPCRFPIKAMGRAENDFDALVVELIRKHVPDMQDTTVQKRLSRGGQYLSVTVTIEAVSKAQLDGIYMELTAHERILYAL